MRTSIQIDETLMATVMRALNAKTKSEAIDQALRTTLRLRQQEALRDLRGIGWDGDLDDMRTSKYIPAE
ncbi:type II toxin-antitoxin system VapB family antitoxin [Sphingomonas sp. Tas61C01]|uniref:type II toxin-antitoxin system VapB family antitoxin n=1 Tax=Sphingomonas sp. Tas61C01 TaxID=3458297 RepID=UPI00403ED924